jgi:hypothetical protein
MDSHEKVLWNLVRKFETLTADRYQQISPELLSPRKLELVHALRAAAPDDTALGATDLAGPVEEVLAASREHAEGGVLLVQGMLIEQLGRAIYKAAAAAPLTPNSRALAELGVEVSADACDRLPELIRERLGSGEPLFEAFSHSTRPVLAVLDVIGEKLDAHFADRFGLRFADLLGEVASEVLPACLALGMNRRKVVCHLTSALMGAA